MTAAAINWTTPYKGLMEANVDDGEWTISAYDVARLSYTPNVPGTTGDANDDASQALFTKAYDEWRNHPGKEDRTEEYQRLGHCFGGGLHDTMYAETVEEAKLLAEAMAIGDEGLAACEEQLLAAGFTRKYPDDDVLGGLWTIRIRSGSYDVHLDDQPGKRYLTVRYHGDGAQSWHNVASVHLETTGRSGKVAYYAYPAQATDPLRVGVAHAINIMKLRLARGGRFSKPLGEVLKP